MLFPKCNAVRNFLSMTLAATERDQGEKFVIEAGSGPELPAELDVSIPFFMEWKAPIAIGSSK